MALAKFRTPTSVLLRRAQITLILAALVPTILMTATGIILLVLGEGSVNVVAGILVLAFCTSALTGYILGSIFLSRGASLAMVQNDFLSSVSHELRTPLTSIRLYLDTLRQDRVKDPAERSKCLAVIDQELARLDGLVGKLLQLSRIESGRQLFDERPVFLEEVVAEGLSALDALRLGSEVDLEVDVDKGLEVIGDRAALGQALANLLTNAWKHSDATRRAIRVRARATGPAEVEVSVRDNGPGLTAAEQKRIFEAFERGKNAIARRTEGFGLGLAIVRAIVHAHRGRIEIASPPGEGAEFRIVLPRRAA